MFLLELFRLDERRQDIVTALLPYKDDRNVFISFRNIPKLGVNPQSSYDTPLGIYAYPLAEMWLSVKDNAVPFAGNMEYVVVFRAIGHIPDVDPNHINGFTEDMLRRDLEIIETKYLKQFTEWYRLFAADHSWGNQKRYIDQIHHLLLSDPSEKRMFKSLKWAETFLDETISLYTNPEIVSDGYITRETLDKIAILRDEFDKGKPVDPAEAKEKFTNEIMNWCEEANRNIPASKFWNVTRNLAILMMRTVVALW